MRFGIRDLLWLIAVAALAATIYIDRTSTQRLIAKWDELSELQAQKAAADIAALRATIMDLREQMRILKHQLAVPGETARQAAQVVLPPDDADQ